MDVREQKNVNESSGPAQTFYYLPIFRTLPPVLYSTVLSRMVMQNFLNFQLRFVVDDKGLYLLIPVHLTLAQSYTYLRIYQDPIHSMCADLNPLVSNLQRMSHIFIIETSQY